MQNDLIASTPLEQATTALQDFTITELSLDEKAFAEKHGLFKSLERPLTQAEQRIIEREAAILKELLAAQEEGKIDENQFTTELSRRWTEVAVESIKESRAHLENEIISYLKKAGGFLSSEELDAAAEMIKKSENYLEVKKNLDSMLFSRKVMRDIYIGVPLDLAEDTRVFFTRLKRDPKGLIKDIANGVYKTGSFLGQHLGELLDEAECLDIESGSYNPARAAALCEKHANELGPIIEAVKKDPSGYARKFIVTYIKWRALDAVLQKGLNVAGNAFKDASGKVAPRATTAAERAAESTKITQKVPKPRTIGKATERTIEKVPEQIVAETAIIEEGIQSISQRLPKARATTAEEFLKEPAIALRKAESSAASNLATDMKVINGKEVSLKEYWKSLMRDPDHGNAIRQHSIDEASAAIKAEEAGLLKGPLKRDTQGGDFIDSLGQQWDVKKGISRTPNGRHIFDANHLIIKAKEDILCGEKIIFDLTKLDMNDYDILKQTMNNMLTTEELKKIIIVL